MLLCLPALAQGPINFQYFYDDLGQLVKVVDSEGNVIEYVYDEVGNILEVKRSSIAGLPAVFRFEPRQGPAGATVVIEGRGFGGIAGENTVSFNGVGATVVSAASDALQVNVPPGATTGPISVTVGADTATSDRDFTVIRAPVITSISPNVATPGQVIFDFRVTGQDLFNSSFTFTPTAPPPGLNVESISVASDGASAVFTLLVDPNIQFGQFVLFAANSAGSSNPTASPGNTFAVLDPAEDADGDGLSNGDEMLILLTDPVNPDTDGDGFPDGLEVGIGSDPLDPNSRSGQFPGNAVSTQASILNANPPPHQPNVVSTQTSAHNAGWPQHPSNAVTTQVSTLNANAPAGPGNAVTTQVSTLNTNPPPYPGVAVGQVVSIQNGSSP